jgi:hypothetical protein
MEEVTNVRSLHYGALFVVSRDLILKGCFVKSPNIFILNRKTVN